MTRQEDVLVRFGARVRALCLSKGYSQESFAEKCNLDRTYVGGIERIATALNMAVSELMAGL